MESARKKPSTLAEGKCQQTGSAIQLGFFHCPPRPLRQECRSRSPPRATPVIDSDFHRLSVADLRCSDVERKKDDTACHRHFCGKSWKALKSITEPVPHYGRLRRKHNKHLFIRARAPHCMRMCTGGHEYGNRVLMPSRKPVLAGRIGCRRSFRGRPPTTLASKRRSGGSSTPCAAGRLANLHPGRGRVCRARLAKNCNETAGGGDRNPPTVQMPCVKCGPVSAVICYQPTMTWFTQKRDQYCTFKVNSPACQV